MNRFEVIENAFEKVNGYVNGRAIWKWIETEVYEQGHDGECTLEDQLFINNILSKVTYEIEVKRDYDEEEDLHTTDIKLTLIRVEGELIFSL
jgi:hypothetical protein